MFWHIFELKRGQRHNSCKKNPSSRKSAVQNSYSFSSLFYAHICCSFQLTSATDLTQWHFLTVTMVLQWSQKNRSFFRYIFVKEGSWSVSRLDWETIKSYDQWAFCLHVRLQCSSVEGPAPFMQSRQSRGRPSNTKCLINLLICCDCRAWKACFLAIWGQKNPVPRYLQTHKHTFFFAIHYLAYFHMLWWE